ncbi:hypothetical protein D9M69_703200 [compost metagenome]
MKSEAGSSMWSMLLPCGAVVLASPPKSCIKKSPSLSSSSWVALSSVASTCSGVMPVAMKSETFSASLSGSKTLRKTDGSPRFSKACSSFSSRISRMRRSPLIFSVTAWVNR